MSKISSVFMMIALAAAGLAAGYFFNSWQHEQKLSAAKITNDSQTTFSNVRPLFKLNDLEGNVRDVKEWDGNVLMINFWATWCPPCRKEMPAFIELQEKYQDKGFTIIGIALDEKQAVIDFTEPMGMNYPILLGDQQGMPLTTAYGNRLGVLPFTVIVDRHGNIIHRKRSEITFQQAEAMIKPLL